MSRKVGYPPHFAERGLSTGATPSCVRRPVTVVKNDGKEAYLSFGR